MKVEVFTLCDAAADYQGRLSILGIFNFFFAKDLPASHPHCAVALRLRLIKAEEGKHSLILHIVDEDGTLIIPALNGEFGVKLPENERAGTVNLVLNLQGLSFNHLGEYAINLVIDGQEIGSIPFWVKQSQSNIQRG